MSLTSTNAQNIPQGEGPKPVRLAAIFIIGLCLVAAAQLQAGAIPAIWAWTLGLSLLAVSGGLALAELIRLSAERRTTSLLAAFFEHDAAPSFLTDVDGALISANPAARTRFEPTFGDTLAATLRGTFADPVAVLHRLNLQVQDKSFAREDIVTRNGPVRLSIQKLRRHRYLWRIEDVAQSVPARRPGDSLPIPMMTVSKTGAILFMNEVARTVLGARLTALERLFVHMPPRPGDINMVYTSDGVQPFRVVEHNLTAGRREMILIPDGTAADAFPSLDRLPVAMLRLDEGGIILNATPTAMSLLGEEAASGTPLDQVMEGLGRPIKDWLQETTEGRIAPKSEFLRLKRRDREAFAQVTLSAIELEGHTQLIAVLSDATELKTLEAQFVQSQKMQAIGQLAGGVAHDFNNLLTAISGHCDLLLLRHDQGDEDFADLMQITQNANRAASLVGQLLAFSRKQTLQPETLDIRDTLSDLTHLLNRLVGERVTLSLVHQPILGAIRADKRQLEQVLMNLVVNARDAMPDGGEIRISTETLSLKSPLVRDRASLAPGDYVLVKVSDEGSGIAPDDLQKVFEPFYTTKRTGEGTGLGLSTAYGIVKQSGGFIFVDSVVGRGTEFSLIFPARQHAVVRDKHAKKEHHPSPPKHGEGVVLLVEDEAPVRAFATRALRLRGYTVIEAASAEAALELLEDADLGVDLFVTDVVMPGLDGPSWVRQALKTRPDVPVVFMSGYAEGNLSERDDNLPKAAFLQKPFSLNELTEVVHTHLGEEPKKTPQGIDA